MENKTEMTMNEKLFEAMLKIATDEALREEMEALPSNEELNKMYPRTESLDKKVFAVINKEFKTTRKKKILRIVMQSAAVFSIIIVVSGIILMSVEASRNYIINTLIDMRSDYVVFDFGTDNLATTETSGFSLNYLPEGFELISNQSMEKLLSNIYTDEIGNMIFVQRFYGESLSVVSDTEYTNYAEIQLNMGTVHLLEAMEESGQNIIMWKHENDVINISTSLDLETLVKIAENLSVY